MIVYSGIKRDFMTSVEDGTIADEIKQAVLDRMGRHTQDSEFRSWNNSLKDMYVIMNDPQIPDNSGVAIEYNIPQTSKRVDFIVSGYDRYNQANAVIIELKQWEKLTAVEGVDAIVETYTGKALRQVVHPSYQAWSYAQLIRDYNATVQDRQIGIKPCAFLHNYTRIDNDPLTLAFRLVCYHIHGTIMNRGNVYEVDRS